MRYLDQTIKDKLLLAQQTLYNNAQPSMEVIAVRPRTAIFHERFWQESIVTAGVTAVCTSVAIKRTKRWGETIYVAYVDTNDLLTVKSAPFVFPIRKMSWTTIETVANCTACALEFEGRFRHNGANVHFLTDTLPYLFYVTAAGALVGGVLGSEYEIIAAAGVTAVDVINGVSNTYDAQNQGFFVFYIIDGSVYYNSLFDGTWEGQRSVSIAPANAVKIKAERTFDYRIILQVTDNTGALYEIFTKMEATGWNGTDFISMNVGVVADLVEVFYSDLQNTENISLDVSVLGYPVPMLMATYSPTLLSAYNIATVMEDPENPGTFYDDYGYRVVFRFDQWIFKPELARRAHSGPVYITSIDIP